MKANVICETAAKLVSADGDRAKAHGDKYHTHAAIADLWSAYLGCLVTPTDVALMMIMLKIVRAKAGQPNVDDFVDMAGYAGCAGEVMEAEYGEPDGGSYASNVQEAVARAKAFYAKK